MSSINLMIDNMGDLVKTIDMLQDDNGFCSPEILADCIVTKYSTRQAAIEYKAEECGAAHVSWGPLESKAEKACNTCRHDGGNEPCLTCNGTYPNWEPIEPKAEHDGCVGCQYDMEAAAKYPCDQCQRDKFREALVELSRIGPSSNTSGNVRAFAIAILEGRGKNE